MQINDINNPYELIDKRFDRLEHLFYEFSQYQKTDKGTLNIDQHQRLTRKELSSKFKISVGKIHHLMKQGLPYEKIGRKTLFKLQDVEEYFSKYKRALETA